MSECFFMCLQAQYHNFALFSWLFFFSKRASDFNCSFSITPQQFVYFIALRETVTPRPRTAGSSPSDLQEVESFAFCVKHFSCTALINSNKNGASRETPWNKPFSGERFLAPALISVRLNTFLTDLFWIPLTTGRVMLLAH